MTTWVIAECSSRRASSRAARAAGRCLRSAHRGLVRVGQPVGGPRAEAGLHVPAHELRGGLAVAVPHRLEQQPVLGGPGVAFLRRSGRPPVRAGGSGRSSPRARRGSRPAGRCARRGGWPRGSGGGSPARRGDGRVLSASSPSRAARTSARSASVRRCAASDAASGSRLRRISSRSRASVASSGRTRASRWASRSTRPSCLSRRSASRRGVVLIPIVCARAAWGRTAPGASSPDRMSARTRV